jgi:DNA polymerase III epsilon subunit family exonuclease
LEITADCIITAFDLETTGLSASWDRIVELGAIRWQYGNELASYQCLINPQRPMPPAVIEVHGITDDDVKDSPFIEEKLSEYIDFLQADIVVAHNARFDIGFLRQSCLRTGIPMPSLHYIDTCALARRTFPGLTSYSLPTLRDHFGLGGTVSHRALEDTRVCLQLFLLCIDNGGVINEYFNEGMEGLPQHLESVKTAIAEHREVMIEYCDGKGRVTKRRILPLGVDGGILQAHCTLRNDNRHFNIDRIRRVW